MANTTIKTRFILRNDTAANWAASTVILSVGEIAVENDTSKFKFGDGTNTYAKLPYAAMLPSEVAAKIADSAVQTVTVGSGTNNGTIKLTVDGNTVDNIAVTGLGSAAYTDASAYATAAQGAKADAAMPIAGGAFTGEVTLAADPTKDLGAATKKYVDNLIKTSIAGADAMVFKGTLGTSGTITALPASDDTTIGDTYKVIDDTFTLPSASSFTGKDESLKNGDLLVAMTTSAWLVVPSGNEKETYVSVNTTGVNVNSTVQSGEVVFGMAAAKQVATEVNDSTDLPTAAAVKTYVDGEVAKTTDENVKATATTGTREYLAGVTGAGTAGVSYNEAVYVDTDNKLNATAGFVGNLTGTASEATHAASADSATKATSATTAVTANTLANGIAATVSGAVTGTAAAANAGDTMAISTTKLDTDYLANGVNTLILDGGSASA